MNLYMYNSLKILRRGGSLSERHANDCPSRTQNQRAVVQAIREANEAFVDRSKQSDGDADAAASAELKAGLFAKPSVHLSIHSEIRTFT